MGALTRATRAELADCVKDESWWPEVFAEIAGGRTLKELCDERAWAFGEVYRTIRGDDALRAAYDEAKRGQAEFDVDAAREAVNQATVETVPVAKLKSEFGLKLAGKLDRARYGEKVDYIGVALDPLSEMLREISERRMKLIRDGEKVVEPATVQVVEDAVVIDREEI